MMFCRVRRSLWLSLTLLLILAILASWLSWRQYDFEKALHTLSIDFDDLPNDYANALMHSDHPQGDIRYDDSLLPEPDPNLHIPPIIHFIWYHDLYNEHLDVSLIPSTGSDAPDHCANVNTNFTIMIWNGTAARSFLEENYPWIMPTYNSYRHPIQRVDALKYFVLWHYGGVYMDLDISCRRSLRPLLPFPAWLPKATPFGVNNDLMAARRHHPLIGQMTESLERRNKNLLFPYLTIFWATGPQFTSDMLKAYWLESGTGYVKGDNKSAASADRFFVLPLPFYSEEYTFFGHSPGGTWHEGDVAVVLWFVDRPWIAFAIALCLIGACVYLALRRMKHKPWFQGMRNKSRHDESYAMIDIEHERWQRSSCD